MPPKEAGPLAARGSREQWKRAQARPSCDPSRRPDESPVKGQALQSHIGTGSHAGHGASAPPRIAWGPVPHHGSGKAQQPIVLDDTDQQE